MIPFLSRLFSRRPNPDPPCILPGEGLRLTQKLDVSYRIAYIRKKSVPSENTYHEIVVREPSGRETSFDLTAEVRTIGKREISMNPCPHGPLVWGADGRTLYFSRQQMEALDTVSGEIRLIPLPFPDKYRYELLGRTTDGQFVVSRFELKAWGKLPVPLPVHTSETIHRVNIVTGEFNLFNSIHENQYLSNQMYDAATGLLVYTWNRANLDGNSRSIGLSIVDYDQRRDPGSSTTRRVSLECDSIPG